jgi:hypothetical protein
MIAWMWPPTCSEENPFNLSEVYSRLATQRQLHALMDLLPLSRNNSSVDFLGKVNMPAAPQSAFRRL